MKLTTKLFVQKSVITLTLAFLVCFPCFNAGCALPSQGASVLGGDFSTPCFLGLTVRGDDAVLLEFSGSVSLSDIHVAPATATEEDFLASSVESCSPAAAEPGSEKQRIDSEKTVYEITLKEPTVVGTDYVLSATATDDKGNSLRFSAGFSGYNANVPVMVLSEVLTKTGTLTVNKIKYTRSEAVELLALTDGNLAGMELRMCYDKHDTEYVFPSLNVKAGDYVVLHLRTKDEEACIDETDDKAGCTYPDSSAEAWDLYYPGDDKLIGDYGILMLKDRAGEKPKDALIYAKSDMTEWKNDMLVEAAKEAAECGAWADGFLPDSAFFADNATAAKALNRAGLVELAAGFDKDGSDSVRPAGAGKADWYIATKLTLGTANDPNVYVK
ncbi:MAG: hypothetical protein MJ183_02295 [Treponemataceae bacterium]|nr:hypothetical protein [Treponemataceae bacterium]